MREIKFRVWTIILGNKLWENVIDDMNTTEIWGIGGMLWTSKKKATACMKHLKNPVYSFESKDEKFKVARVTINFQRKKRR